MAGRDDPGELSDARLEGNIEMSGNSASRLYLLKVGPGLGDSYVRWAPDVALRPRTGYFFAHIHRGE